METNSPGLARDDAAPPAESPPVDEDYDDENIYEVMKAQMRRKQEELEVKNAEFRKQQRSNQYGRPGPVQPAPAAAPPVEIVADPSDLPAVWSAARRYLETNARSLNTILGHSCQLLSLSPQSNEALLRVPGTQRGFTNERARLKLEEALRAVTALPLRLVLEFTEETISANATNDLPPGTPSAPAVTTQRIPPEVIDAVKDQPIVKQLMKNLDATVVHIEMLNTDDS